MAETSYGAGNYGDGAYGYGLVTAGYGSGAYGAGAYGVAASSGGALFGPGGGVKHPKTPRRPITAVNDDDEAAVALVLTLL